MATHTNGVLNSILYRDLPQAPAAAEIKNIRNAMSEIFWADDGLRAFLGQCVTKDNFGISELLPEYEGKKVTNQTNERMDKMGKFDEAAQKYLHALATYIISDSFDKKKLNHVKREFAELVTSLAPTIAPIHQFNEKIREFELRVQEQIGAVVGLAK